MELLTDFEQIAQFVGTKSRTQVRIRLRKHAEGSLPIMARSPLQPIGASFG